MSKHTLSENKERFADAIADLAIQLADMYRFTPMQFIEAMNKAAFRARNQFIDQQNQADRSWLASPPEKDD